MVDAMVSPWNTPRHAQWLGLGVHHGVFHAVGHSMADTKEDDHGIRHDVLAFLMCVPSGDVVSPLALPEYPINGS